MKKLVASVGLVALGMSGVQTLSAQDLTSPDQSKPWNISATLRGFYDDNFNTIPDDFQMGDGYSKDTFGFEVSPSASLNLNMERTTLGMGYTYSYKYYDEDSQFETDNYSQSHEFQLALDHAFSSRYRVSVRDNFVIGQEPDQLRVGNTYNKFERISGDNIRNLGEIDFNADITRNFGIEVGYANSFSDYDAEDGFSGDLLTSASPSGLLDRIQHEIHLDGRLTLAPSTIGILGYQFSQTDYTGDEKVMELTTGPLAGTDVESEDRNNRSHYVYVGADHTFRPDLTASLRAGGRYNDYYNTDEDSVSPFVRGSVRWTYAPQSFAEGGVSYDRTATDVVGAGGDDFTRDQDAFTIFGSINHQILPKLLGSLTGQFQNSSFNGGTFDDESEQFYLAGLSLEYQFNRHFSAHAGYNYDLLNSDLPGREYDRNRVYLGVTAAY